MKNLFSLGRSTIILTAFLAVFNPSKTMAGKINGWADLGAMLASAELGPISLVIGACASVSLISVAPPPNNWTVVKNHDNLFDNYGATHNQIIDDYFKENKTYDLQKFYSYADKNKAKYGVKNMPAFSEFSKAVSQYAYPVSTDEVKRKIKMELAKSGVNGDLIDQISSIKYRTFEEYSNAILKIEKMELNTKLNGEQKKKLSILFSVLRHSAKYDTY